MKEGHGAGKHVDETGSKIGMWLFLFTELVLFGGMFLLYSVYRFTHPVEFHEAAKELNVFLGTANTVILVTSSFTMALSIAAIRKGKKSMSIGLQLTTIALGLFFLVNKYFEWGAKIHHGIFPNSEKLLHMAKGDILFFGLYYTMTGLHGLHVLIGMVVIAFMVNFTVKDKIGPEDYIKLENTGLYWHLVDLIWIYLFPLFYLIT